MKRIAALFGFVLMVGTMFAEKPKANPANYPLTAHVVFSRLIGMGESLEVIIDSQPLEMSANGMGLIVPGDYQARLVGLATYNGFKQVPNRYEVTPTYELLFPDGRTRQFLVSGMGLKGGTFGSGEPSVAAQ